MNILFCNIAWMKYYQGITDEDKPYNGGSWVTANRLAEESNNFKNYNGKCYGYIPLKGNISLEKNFENIHSKDSFVDDVLVVWCAKSPDKGTVIVGWYKNARVYREEKNIQIAGDNLKYRIEAEVVNCVLIPENKRMLQVPHGKGGMGQKSIWYAKSEIGENFVPRVIKYIKRKESIDACDKDIEYIVNYLKQYHGKKYKRIEDLANIEQKNEMIEFLNRGQNARNLLLDIAREAILDESMDRYIEAGCNNWINQAQYGCNYFWIEFKRKEFKESLSSISLVVSIEDYYLTSLALSVDIKDSKCTEDDYRKHNRLISCDLSNNDLYYVTTNFKDDKHSITNISREEIMKKYHNREIKKIKLQMDINEPYTDLISRLRAGIKVLEPYYLLAVSDELSDGYEFIEDDEVYYEGSVTTVKVNKYERNPEARRKCIENHGCQCKICDFDFEKVYGAFGKGKIHIHHIKPLNEIGKEYIVDPINDLIPVCPNCHMMLHSRKPAFKPNEVKSFIDSNK